MCSSPRAGERILASITRYLKRSLKLIVNENKSRVVPLQEATFLGFSIIRRKIRWTEKSQKKFKAEVRRLTKRTRGHSPVKVIADLRAYLRGAVNYYRVKGFAHAAGCDWNPVWRHPHPRPMAASPHETLLLETVGKASDATA